MQKYQISEIISFIGAVMFKITKVDWMFSNISLAHQLVHKLSSTLNI